MSRIYCNYTAIVDLGYIYCNDVMYHKIVNEAWCSVSAYAGLILARILRTLYLSSPPLQYQIFLNV